MMSRGTMLHRTKMPPAVVALLIQLASFCVIPLLLFFLWQVNNVKLTLPEVVLWQSIIVLIITRGFHLEWWWSVIQPLFPLAVMAMWALMLPPSIYLLIFGFFVVFYWSTFRTRVPYYPSSKEVWRVVEQWLPQNRPISFVDIGSGLGGLVLDLGQKYPRSRFLGIEIAPLPWLLSYLRTVGRSNAHFICQNYENSHFSEFDVVFAYLSPAAMPDLWAKAKAEMRPGSLLISSEFPIPGVDPDQVIYVNNRGVNVYLWRM